MQPLDIETLSFSIIDQESGDHGFTNHEWNIVRRMIHTSADFDYIKTVKFHPKAIETGLSALKKGCTIITDTNMARVGIRKGETVNLGGEVKCLIADQDVAALAREKGVTRAYAAVDRAVSFLNGSIYVVGNAPTALLRLIELIREKRVEPSLVIGLPVGFVNAAESKDALMELDIPYISNKGRKGGSNVAASVINALLIMADAKH
ncbi:MAG: precorrin-8X methylmutase [Desulfamplus sp.]|nr:precorrin-8X methylmutase [Desulfamplus sp.]